MNELQDWKVQQNNISSAAGEASLAEQASCSESSDRISSKNTIIYSIRTEASKIHAPLVNPCHINQPQWSNERERSVEAQEWLMAFEFLIYFPVNRSNCCSRVEIKYAFSEAERNEFWMSASGSIGIWFQSCVTKTEYGNWGAKMIYLQW